MGYIIRFLRDLFSLKFDIIIPVSGCIVAFLLAIVIFLIGYLRYIRKKRNGEIEGNHDGNIEENVEKRRVI